MKISIIIPIFNHQEYVVDCLRSVVEQNDGNYEIIAIDDGSQDASYDTALNYLTNALDSERWILQTRQNRGICKTLNEAIKLSSGEIIFPLASDDRVAPGFFDAIRQVYASTPNNQDILLLYDVALINTSGRLVDASSASLRPHGGRLLSVSKAYLASEIMFRWSQPFAHQFYSRKFYDYIGGYAEALKFEDLYFALMAVSLNKFAYTPLVLKEYRLRDAQSITPGLTMADLNTELVYKYFENPVSLRYGLMFWLKNKTFQRGLTSVWVRILRGAALKILTLYAKLKLFRLVVLNERRK